MNKYIRYVVLGLFFVLTLMFLIIPVSSVFLQSFVVDKQWSIQNYVTVFSNPYYSTALVKTIRLAIVSSIIALVIGMLVVLIFKVYFFKQYQKLIVISNLFMNFSGVQLAFAFIILFGHTGIINLLLDGFASINIYGETGLTMVFVYFQIPFAVILLMPVFEGLDSQWIQAGLMLKANPIHVVKRVYLPIMMPSITIIFTLLFANAMSAYVTPYALVGNNYGIYIIRMANLVSGDVTLNPNLASAMAVVLIVMLLAMLLVGYVMNAKERRYEITS